MSERWTRRETLRVLLGILLISVSVVAVLIAFRSTNGLPFEDPYRLTVRVPDAAQLTSGSDVTIDGGRVGQVVGVRPVGIGNDGSAAAVEIKLDGEASPLPVDSTFAVEQSGAVSRKVLAVRVGRSTDSLTDGATVGLGAGARPPVEFDDLLNAFDSGARDGWGKTVEALGLGLADRGRTLNRAFAETPQLLDALEPSMRAFGRPRARLRRFVRASAALMAEVRPAAPELPPLVTGLDGTFESFASVARPYLQDMISRTPGSLSRTGAGLQATRPMLQAGRRLFDDFAPAARLLPTAAPAFADVLERGTESLPRVPAIDRRMIQALARVGDFGEAPVTRPGVRRLTLAATSLRAPLRTIGPTETRCGYLSLLARNLSSSMQEAHATGASIRAGGVVVGVDRDSERGPSSHPYEGQLQKALGPVHSNPYPNTAAPGQPRECEAGNEPYVSNRAVIGNVPGRQELETEETSLP